MTRYTLLVAWLAVAACGQPAAARRAPGPLPAGDSSAAAGTPLPGLTEDVTRLRRPSNAERFDALTALLRERRIPFEVQTFPNSRRKQDARPEGHNVIVTLGSGSREIVLGAHYDAVRLPDSTLSAGMVDNGAGTIVLLRAAEALGKARLHHRVRVVFFDMEEIGLVGSAHFVRTLDRSRVAAMVNLDVISDGNTLIFGPAAREGNADVYGAMGRVCARARVTCVEFPEFPPSDDRRFQAAGIPNISLAVVPRVDAHQLWLLLNGGPTSGLREGFVPQILQTIHTPADLPEKPTPAAMTLAYNAVLGLVSELDAALR